MTIGFIVGRFQIPFLHEGHKHLIDNSLSLCDKLVIVLGVSEKKDERNYLSYHYRRKIIKESYPGVEVTYIKDTNSDKDWSKDLDFLVKHYGFLATDVLLFGSRDSFIKGYTGIYKKHYINIPEIPGISATKIREELKA